MEPHWQSFRLHVSTAHARTVAAGLDLPSRRPLHGMPFTRLFGTHSRWPRSHYPDLYVPLPLYSSAGPMAFPPLMAGGYHGRPACAASSSWQPGPDYTSAGPRSWSPTRRPCPCWTGWRLRAPACTRLRWPTGHGVRGRHPFRTMTSLSLRAMLGSPACQACLLPANCDLTRSALRSLNGCLQRLGRPLVRSPTTLWTLLHSTPLQLQN